MREHGRGLDGRSDDVRRPVAGAGKGRGGGTVHGLQAQGLSVMPGVIVAETAGRLSASVPTPPSSSSRQRSVLLITTVVVQAGRADMQADGPSRPKSSGSFL